MGSRQRQRRAAPRHYCLTEPLTCTVLNETAQCVIKAHGATYVIEELWRGETARVVIFYADQRLHYGRAIALLVAAPERVLPLGHIKMQLGSYQLALVNDAAQDAWKTAAVRALFGPHVPPIIVGRRTYYRNKVVLHDGGFRRAGTGRKAVLRPRPEDFDLMAIDFTRYAAVPGDLIIRRLDTEIVGPPGANLHTTDHFLNKVFRVGLNAFYQVNREMALRAYSAIKEFVWPGALVVDCFAGAATIAICVADVARQVYAVEINQASHADALTNIALNDATNVTAVLSDVHAFFNAPDRVVPEIIIVDPARSGLGPALAATLNATGAARIIYLSCNIYTQHRDVALLTNYRVTHVQPYDFFPQTYHIENLVVLDKQPAG